MASERKTTAHSTKSVSEKDLECIRSTENEQGEFKNLVAKSKSFSKTEKAVVKLETVAEFDAFWQNMNDAKEDFERSRKSGCGLHAKHYQSSAAVVRNFMKDFSPIIDIVKDFAAPYGGMAVGTISVFFVVAASKDAMEERLALAISEIQDRLPGLNLYRHIYNDNHELDVRLQTQIVSAYQGFTEFCIEASKYYKGSGPRRWLKALGTPNNILDKAEQVQLVTVKIRRLCDELLDKNVHLIKQLNIGKFSYQFSWASSILILWIDQKMTIERLEDKTSQLLIAQDDNILTEIQRLLDLSSFSDENQRKELDQYREAIESDEHLNAAYFEQMRGSRFDSFKAGKDYQSWIESEHPCLLILSGYNNQSICYLDQCWLSPVAMAMITDLGLSPNHPIYAYYHFGPHGELLYRALSVIFLQLLRQKREVFRNRSQYDEFRAEIDELRRYEHGDDVVMDTEEERLSAFQKIALRVINFFDESEIVHIIVDRADRCCDLKNKIDHRKPLLKTLVRVVEAARCKLRMLVVINGSQWSVERRCDELGAKIEGKVIVHTAEQGYST